MSFYQDIIREIQVAIGEHIDDRMEEKEQMDIQSIVVMTVVFGVFVVLCPLIVFAVYTLTSQIQRYSVSIATRYHFSI